MDDLRVERWAVSTITEEAENPPVERAAAVPARACYVYVLEVPGCVKIGSGASPRDRLNHVQVGNHLLVSLAGQHATPNKTMALRIEDAAHEALKDCWVRGEWFATTPEIANAIISALIANPPAAKARYVHSGKRWPYRTREQ
jgi:hypothetical protein